MADTYTSSYTYSIIPAMLPGMSVWVAEVKGSEYRELARQVRRGLDEKEFDLNAYVQQLVMLAEWAQVVVRFVAISTAVIALDSQYRLSAQP